MFWKIGQISTLNGYHRKLSNYYFLIIGIPIIILFISIMWWYSGMNSISMELQQKRLMGVYRSWLLYISIADIVAIVVLLRWYWGKLKVIRVFPSFTERLTRYYDINLKYYFMMGLVALPLVPLYIYTGFLFFVGIYSVIVFMVMAMERPSIYRTIRNLRLGEEERKIVKEGGEIPLDETQS